MADGKKKSELKRSKETFGNTVKRPSTNLKPDSKTNKKKIIMSDKSKSKSTNLNIGKNTKWDIPNVDPKAGSTIRKPPISLDPNKQK